MLSSDEKHTSLSDMLGIYSQSLDLGCVTMAGMETPGSQMLFPVNSGLAVHMMIAFLSRHGMCHEQQATRTDRGQEIVKISFFDVLYYLYTIDHVYWPCISTLCEIY
jgi:hypothetical protein